MPKKCDISSGEDIQVNFTKSLRDYQTNIVDVYINYVNQPIYNNSDSSLGYGCILEVPCGRGKTVMALKILSDLKLKTLVVVHKGFLLNQWVERIEQFLPGARIGKIQGPVIDIENKDIVIGMLQSLSMKDYNDDLFSSFGLTIVDELSLIHI